MTGDVIRGRVRDDLTARLARTQTAVRAALVDRTGRMIAGGATVGYLVLYAVAVGDLGLNNSDRIGVTVVNNPVGRAGAGEAVALIEAGLVEYLVTPAGILTGIVLGALVGVNLAVTTLVWRRPAACGVSPATGLLAGVPALLSGTACCGPLVLIVLGIQATGTLLTVLSWALPVAVLLLIGSLVYAAGRIDPAVGTDR